MAFRAALITPAVGIAAAESPDEIRRWSLFRSAEFIVDRFELNGDTALVRGRLRTVNMKRETGFIPVKETFHQKFRPGKTPN